MTRSQKIFSLRLRYADYARRRMHKAANAVYAQLKPLMTLQLKAERRATKAA